MIGSRSIYTCPFESQTTTTDAHARHRVQRRRRVNEHALEVVGGTALISNTIDGQRDEQKRLVGKQLGKKLRTKAAAIAGVDG